MKQVFVDWDYTRVGYFGTLLEEAGIPSYIRNEYSHSSVTELPSPLFFPTLCVVNDEDYDRALDVLRPIADGSLPIAPDWHCPACGEPVPGGFEICWKCKAPRPA